MGYDSIGIIQGKEIGTAFRLIGEASYVEARYLVEFKIPGKSHESHDQVSLNKEEAELSAVVSGLEEGSTARLVLEEKLSSMRVMAHAQTRQNEEVEAGIPVEWYGEPLKEAYEAALLDSKSSIDPDGSRLEALKMRLDRISERGREVESNAAEVERDLLGAFRDGFEV